MTSSTPSHGVGHPLPTTERHALRDVDLAELARRWIDRNWDELASLEYVDHLAGKELVHGRNGGNYEGLQIPYRPPWLPHEIACRLRRYNHEVDARSGKPIAKYLSLPGDRNHLYFPQPVTVEHLADISLPIAITEGELKAVALRRLASHGVQALRFLPVAISGVNNYRSVVGATTNQNGVRVPVKDVLPEFDRIALAGRKAIIAFDSDVIQKRQVRGARWALSQMLRERGAEVGFLEWDPTAGKGIDDWLAAAGPKPYSMRSQRSSTTVRPDGARSSSVRTWASPKPSWRTPLWPCARRASGRVGADSGRCVVDLLISMDY